MTILTTMLPGEFFFALLALVFIGPTPMVVLVRPKLGNENVSIYTNLLNRFKFVSTRLDRFKIISTGLDRFKLVWHSEICLVL